MLPEPKSPPDRSLIFADPQLESRLGRQLARPLRSRTASPLGPRIARPPPDPRPDLHLGAGRESHPNRDPPIRGEAADGPGQDRLAAAYCTSSDSKTSEGPRPGSDPRQAPSPAIKGTARDAARGNAHRDLPTHPDLPRGGVRESLSATAGPPRCVGCIEKEASRHRPGCFVGRLPRRRPPEPEPARRRSAKFPGRARVSHRSASPTSAGSSSPTRPVIRTAPVSETSAAAAHSAGVAFPCPTKARTSTGPSTAVSGRSRISNGLPFCQTVSASAGTALVLLVPPASSRE